MNHFNLAGPVLDVGAFKSWHNALQRAAERTRLGIAMNLASDQRHAVGTGGCIALPSGALTKWPDPIGLAATGDAQLGCGFANIARQEYLAVGILLDCILQPTLPRNRAGRGSRPPLHVTRINIRHTGKIAH